MHHVSYYMFLKTKNIGQLEMWPMPNVLVALPNIGGAICSTPRSMAEAHYYRVTAGNMGTLGIWVFSRLAFR